MSTLIYYLRFSSSKQQDGDSIERQHKVCDNYSRLHGLGPVDHVYKDEGKSAFTGANLSEGKLGELLEDLKSGVFRPPVTVLCESVDRISRGEVQVASGLVQTFQEYCTLITAMDSQVYQQGKYDLVGMITLLVKSSLAREESEKKANRSRDTHDANRAAGKYLNDKIKRYLRMSPDRVKANTTVIPEEAEFIRELFKLKRMGYGVHRLLKAQHQFRGNLPEYGKSSMMALFKDAELVDRGIIPQGDLYTTKVDSSKLTGGKRNPTNLFRGILKCGYCGANIIYRAPSNGSKIGRLLCNTRNIHGSSGCDFPYIKYQDFENLMLDGLSLLARELFTHKVVDVDALLAKKEELEASKDSLEKKLDNAYEVFGDDLSELKRITAPTKALKAETEKELEKTQKAYEEAVASLDDVSLITPTTDDERTTFNLRLTKVLPKLTLNLSEDGEFFLIGGKDSDVTLVFDRGLTLWELDDTPASKEDGESPLDLDLFGEGFELVQ